MKPFDMIAFDADDTLWYSEIHYINMQKAYEQILKPYIHPQNVDKILLEKETKNIPVYGYGTKSYMLSMIELAIQISKGQIPTEEIQKIINLGKEMLSADMELIENVPETLEKLSRDYTLMVITKGDLLHQQNKVRRSGLMPFFKTIEVVSEKDVATYQTLLERYQLSPERFLMIGNSLKSDILPVVEMGAQAVYIPNATTWAHEKVDVTGDEKNNYHEIDQIGLLPDLIHQLEK
ncbi:MAG: HAD hydrolase-like protein [Anaerolineaceae bacterium]|nr:HAD hydrolase-like protein [Anaerolineaceae bacterium]